MVPKLSTTAGGGDASKGYSVFDEPVRSANTPLSASPKQEKEQASECVKALCSTLGGDDSQLVARFVMKPGFIFTGRVVPAVDQVMPICPYLLPFQSLFFEYLHYRHFTPGWVD